VEHVGIEDERANDEGSAAEDAQAQGDDREDSGDHNKGPVEQKATDHQYNARYDFADHEPADTIDAEQERDRYLDNERKRIAISCDGRLRKNRVGNGARSRPVDLSGAELRLLDVDAAEGRGKGIGRLLRRLTLLRLRHAFYLLDGCAA